MSEPIAFLPGTTREISYAGRPLGRFLPPIQAGSASAWLAERRSPRTGGRNTGWLLEPFGASPELPVEIARAGYRLLAAVNNPIARFLIELHACPPSASELRSALAELASAQRAGERIEPHIRALYQTECAQCGYAVEAQAFIWDRENNTPVGKIYSCPHCKDSGERPASPADIQRAASFAASGLHRARALERVAPLDDPDRGYAEEALSMYLPRAVYGLFTLVNRLDSFPSARRRLVSALLLAAFDQANVLWAHPAKSYRPRQLNIPPRFQEKNLWLALENAVEAWAAQSGECDVPVTIWPELPPESGGICLFEGRLKDLASQFQEAPEKRIEIQAALTALPRPNQAFWTLSALWAGWLWGHAASSVFKSVLRRRRYDWSWHCVALHSAFNSLEPLLEPGKPCLGLMGEPEAGFLSAALVAAGLSGLELEGVALRGGPEQGQLLWEGRIDSPSQAETPARETSGTRRQSAVQIQVTEYLRQRGEPAHYLPVHAAALSGLAQAHLLAYPVEPVQAAGQSQPAEPAHSSTASPAESLRQVEATIEAALTQGGHFARYAGSSRSLETGQWWLDEAGLQPAEIAEPLADRLEMALVKSLQAQPLVQLHEIDRELCREFPGLFTPELELVQQCLDSYAEPAPVDPDHPAGTEHPAGKEHLEDFEQWRLRQAELPQRRRTDLAEMQLLLMQIGKRLGYRLAKTDLKNASSTRPPLVWQNQSGATQYSFHLIASGVLGRIVLPGSRRRDYSGGKPGVIVLPGGRAGWVEYKLRNDPRLRNAVENGWLLVKFRHVRWLAQNDNLSQENLEELLALDPLTHRDQQMPLL